MSATVLLLYLLPAPCSVSRETFCYGCVTRATRRESVDDASAGVKREELKKKTKQKGKKNVEGELLHTLVSSGDPALTRGTAVTLGLCWGANRASRVLDSSVGSDPGHPRPPTFTMVMNNVKLGLRPTWCVCDPCLSASARHTAH